MPNAARLGDSITGTTAGEHSGHIDEPHTPGPITGNINGLCSSNVFINGSPAACAGSTTIEYDSCCGSSPGKVGGGSLKVFINGRSAARIGDALTAHNGTGNIASGSGNVSIG